MKQYTFKYMGSLGVRVLEFDDFEMSDERAEERVRRNLPHYWPVYYSACVWRADGSLVAEFHSSVVATKKETRA